MKRMYCIFCYPTKQARQAGEMAYAFDADTLAEAVDGAQSELGGGMYCASIWRRSGTAAPMEFVEAHIQPLVPA